MNTKLTLRMDDELIRAAKDYAERSGKSVSQLVADYFALLTNGSTRETGFISPRVHALRGILKGADVDEQDYKDHLLRKYG
jgi:hypothetical protein